MKLAILSLSAALAFGQSVKQNTPVNIIGPLTLSNGAGTLECLQRNTSGVVSGTGVACGVGSGATGPTGPTGSNGTNGAPGATGATGAGLTDCSETSGTLNCPGGFGATGAPASGAFYLGGLTSGGIGFVVADVAGVNKLFLVLPATSGSSGQVLVDVGSTTCPTMPSSMPASPICHQLAWSNLSSIIPATYKTVTCQPGMGDGLNAIGAGTYLQSTCLDEFAATWTITGVKCFTDNNGTSTLNVTNGAGTGLLTGAVTCTNAFAAGTQSGTTTIASGDFVKFTFVSDGTSKQATFVVTGTR